MPAPTHGGSTAICMIHEHAGCRRIDDSDKFAISFGDNSFGRRYEERAHPTAHLVRTVNQRSVGHERVAYVDQDSCDALGVAGNGSSQCDWRGHAASETVGQDAPGPAATLLASSSPSSSKY